MAEPPEPERSYYISAGEVTEGPFDAAALRAQIASGRVDRRYQVWLDDTQRWGSFSLLESLLRSSPAAPGAPERKASVRVARPAAGSLPEAGAAKSPPFEAAGARETPLAGEPLKGIVPRQVPSQRQAAPERDRGDEQEDEDASPRPPPEQPAVSRRRNYSPITAGGNAPRPFTPAPAPAPAEPPAKPPEIITDKAEAAGTEAVPPVSRLAVWRQAATCVGLCVLGILALRMAGLVNFGVRVPEENRRLAGELAATKETLASKTAAVKKLSADKREYLDRFVAAAVVVRRMRTSVFAALRRSLETGDRNATDQRLFELDQLGTLVPEDESERKIKQELVDAYFGVRALSPSPSPAAPPTPPAP